MRLILPKGLAPGAILHHARLYADRDSGELKGKFLLILAPAPGGDAVCRLLTSRPHGRPEAPPCYHGLPYPGFYLGVIGPPLGKKSWLQLNHLDDVDGRELGRQIDAGIVTSITTLGPGLLGAALDCVAGADDTTQAQERAVRAQLALLRA